MKDESRINHKARWLTLFLVSSFILHPSSFVRADGGAVRLCERGGNYQLAVFTSPNPLRVGPVDISVLVQDPATGECTPQTRVTLRVTRSDTGQVLEYPATSEAATNKLFHAAVFELPEAGTWDVEVSVDGPLGTARAGFQVEAGDALPPWLDLWPWYGWPAFAVALFVLHHILIGRPPRHFDSIGLAVRQLRGAR